MDLTPLSIGDLKKLILRIEKEIAGREKRHRNNAIEEIKSVAAKYDLKLDELVSEAVSAKSGKLRKAQNAKTSRPKKSTRSKAVAVRFRHPENSNLTWSGGRGRRPKWVKDWEAAGRSIEEARITEG